MTSSTQSEQPLASAAMPLRRPPRAGVSEYIAIMRLDHMTKHVFVVPGIVLAALLRRGHVDFSAASIAAGLITVVAIASANYVINEWLDRGSDAHHPTKSARAAVRNEMDGRLILLQWGLLVSAGLAAAASANLTMLLTAGLFAAQGVVYNVPPMRTKDVAYLDVLSESVNNPLRLLIGWSMVDPHTLPPSSVILAYWLGGAFLMGAKRLSEYREITAKHGHELLARYRRSFAGYTEMSLTGSCLIYAVLSGMTLAVFFVKYRIEYVLVLVPIALLFGKYMAMSMQAGSTAQKPEKLFGERGLMSLLALVILAFGILSVVNIAMLEPLTAQHFITLD